MLQLKDIIQCKSYSAKTIYFGTGIGSAFFAGLLGGNNINTFLCTFITSIFAVIIYNKVMKLSSIPAFSSLLASTFIAIIGVLLSHIGFLDTPKMLIVGSIMPLLPGVSFLVLLVLLMQV